MSQSIARVPTEHASRYLQQLCKHWSHKLKVEFTPDHGTVDFGGPKVVFDAEPQTLVLTLDAEPEVLDRMEGVVAAHLTRFAFREELQVVWSKAA